MKYQMNAAKKSAPNPRATIAIRISIYCALRVDPYTLLTQRRLIDIVMPEHPLVPIRPIFSGVGWTA